MNRSTAKVNLLCWEGKHFVLICTIWWTGTFLIHPFTDCMLQIWHFKTPNTGADGDKIFARTVSNPFLIRQVYIFNTYDQNYQSIWTYCWNKLSSPGYSACSSLTLKYSSRITSAPAKPSLTLWLAISTAVSELVRGMPCFYFLWSLV